MLPAYSPWQASSNVDVPVPLVSSDSQPNAGEKRPATDPDFESAARPGFSLRPVWKGRVLLTLNQLSVMSQNGIEMADALQIVADTCNDTRLQDSLRAIHQSISAGQSLSSSFAMHGTYFPSTLSAMLAAAEASGDVPETFRRVCTRMRGELTMRGTVFGAMIYPVILIGASSVVMTALVLGVLPQFGRVFASMGRPVPIYTQALLSVGTFCRTYWIGILLALISLVVVGFFMRRTSLFRTPFNRFLMYGPGIRDAYRPLQTGRVLRTIASMVQGGVPLMQAVKLSQRTTYDIYWRALLQRIEGNLIDGLTASAAMSDADFVPPETTQLMATSERTGRVAEVLEDIGAFYEEEAERRIKRLVVMLEPAIIIVMGIVVAGIVMSVMLPLLDVSTIR
ncbi:MAG: type II secretion system F family protein [Rubripirellula sp.]